MKSLYAIKQFSAFFRYISKTIQENYSRMFNLYESLKKKLSQFIQINKII